MITIEKLDTRVEVSFNSEIIASICDDGTIFLGNGYDGELLRCSLSDFIKCLEVLEKSHNYKSISKN